MREPIFVKNEKIDSRQCAERNANSIFVMTVTRKFITKELGLSIREFQRTN